MDMSRLLSVTGALWSPGPWGCHGPGILGHVASDYRRRVFPRLVSALVIALAMSTAPAVAREAGEPTAGSSGIGDAYFPLDGNGGIDVLHYDVRDRYDFGTGLLKGRTTLTVRATQDLSRFNLDFLLKVTAVRVNGSRVTFDRGNRHELRITPAPRSSRDRSSRSRCATPGGPPTRPTSVSAAGSPTTARSSRSTSRTWLRGGSRPTTTRVTRPRWTCGSPCPSSAR